MSPLSKGSVAFLSPKYIFSEAMYVSLASTLTVVGVFKLILLFEVSKISLDLALNTNLPELRII